MNKRKLIIISLVVIFSLSIAIYQYAEEFKADFANAYSSSKPANGHSWSEMECTAGLCVTSDNKVGIGTDSPTEKLHVTGNIGVTGDISSTGTIMATTDVCTGSGACLSDIDDFISSQPLINNVHNYAACEAAGGEDVSIGASYPLCRFSLASCPTGWTYYPNWSAYVSVNASCTCTACGTTQSNCCAGVTATCGASREWASSTVVPTCTAYANNVYISGSDCSAYGSCSCTATPSARNRTGCY
jgi:hypothetical protein